ncbi:Cd efflux system component [Bifidobacterium callimiconis]|uniref:Cd efflux system component n=2 Tax=Bifidobacterium callimiconis TaxID=2306973 RepID=A0A430FIE9_9BIFI|nr:Cd efflux system component [Bifidobacterium callimiconis]
MSKAHSHAAAEPKALPLMLTQAIIAAGVMCVCEIICAPMIISMASGAFALIPWIAVACMLAVLFVLVLGFAFLWMADNLSHNFPERRAPICYAVIGGLSFGIWGGLLYPTFINSVLEPVGIDPISRGNLWAIVFNCVIIGLVSYLCAALFGRRLAQRRAAAITIGVVLLVVTVLGVFYLWRFYAMLY